MITLYAKDATDFTTNGLGVLDGGIATVPEVEETFNGAYTLTLRYVSWGRYRDLIDYDCIIKAPTADGDQRFRIYKITKQIGFVEIVANHIFYDLAGNFIEDANLVDQNGGDALNHIGTSLQSPTNFTFKSNIETTASARLVRLNAVQALLDTSQDNSFVNRWGGELLRDNDQVIFNAVRGSNRGFSVKYGKNLTSYEATIDTTSVVTRIMPYGYDGLMIPEKYVDSDLIDKYPFVHVKKIEYSEIKAIDPDSDSNDDDAVPLEDAYALLRDAAQNEYITNHVDQPQANFKLSFQDLQKTREYADFEALETLLPWDYVSVDADGLPIDARMISYRYDPLNQRYIEVELGNYVSEYTDTVAGKVDSLSSSLMKVSEQVSHAALSANGKNTNYYGSDMPSNPVDGDLWYKQNGDTTELWQYDGKSVPPGWKLRVSDLTGQEISDKVDNALKEFDAVKQAADKAVEQANIAVTQSGLSQESAKAAADAVQAAQAIAQEVSASLAAAQAQAANAAGDAAEALKEAQDALAAANGQSAQVKTLQQIVDDTTGTISTLAKQVDVDTVTQQVKTTQTLAQQTAAGLLLKSDQSVVDTLSGTVKQQSIELKAAQDQLALTLTASDLTKGLSGYATQTWASQQITATATGFQAQLNSVQTSLEAKNLVTDSEFLDTSNLWMISTYTGSADFKPGIDGGGSFRTFFFNYSSFSDAKWSFAKSQKVDVTAITALSASTRIWTATTDISTGAELQIEWYDSAGKIVSSGKSATESVAGLQGKWQTIKSENVSKPTGAVTASLVLFVRQNGRYWFSYPMMNAGTTVADYHPGVADSSQFATLKLTVDGFSTTFAKQTDLQTVSTKTNTTANGLSAIVAVTGANGEKVTSLIANVNTIQSTMSAKGGLTTRLQTLEGFQQTATSTLAGVATTSQVTQLANQLTSSIGVRNLVADSDFSDINNTWSISTYSSSATTRNDFWQTADGGGSGHTLRFQGTSFTDAKWSFAKSRRVSAQSYTKLSASVMVWSTDLDSGAALKIEFVDSAGKIIKGGANAVISDNSKVNAWQTIKTENVAVPSNAATVHLTLFAIKNGNFSFLHPMMNVGPTALLYSASDFAQSQITQLQDAINLRVTKDGIISQINLTAGKTLIQNNSIYLDASTVMMGGTAFINAANIKSIDASTITAGRLDATNLDVIGLNAKSITTGTLTGENLSINLGTGEVTFAKGAIKSTNGHLNIDVNDGTFVQSDGTKGMMFANGNLYLSSYSWWDEVSKATAPKPDYGFIGYGDTLTKVRGFEVVGRDALTLGLTDNDLDGMNAMQYTDAPVIIMDRSSVALNFAGELATIQAGQGFTINKNSVYNLVQTPGIQIGSNVDRTGIGDRVFIDGSYVYIPSAYSRTSSGSANLIVAADGSLVRTSSATKYKSDIQRFSSTDAAERFLEVPQAHWLNKQDLQRYSDDPQHYQFPKYDFGMIAEDLAAKGLEDFVVRGADGQLEDIRYDRIAPALLPLIKEMKLEIDALKEALKS